MARSQVRGFEPMSDSEVRAAVDRFLAARSGVGGISPSTPFDATQAARDELLAATGWLHKAIRSAVPDGIRRRAIIVDGLVYVAATTDLGDPKIVEFCMYEVADFNGNAASYLS